KKPLIALAGYARGRGAVKGALRNYLRLPSSGRPLTATFRRPRDSNRHAIEDALRNRIASLYRQHQVLARSPCPQDLCLAKPAPIPSPPS
ncbi:MAG: hypothetical protein WBX25_04060, partial [Rhodomicrobium sp.]